MNEPIIGNAFTLRFDAQSENTPQPLDLDGRAVMERLAARGCIAFRLQWEDAFEAQLAIEDDVMFIHDAVDDLAELISSKQPHFVHLGDGELEITSTISGNIVSTSIEHAPHSDRRFLKHFEFTYPLHRYVSAWHSLVTALQAIAGQPSPSGS